MYYIVKGMPTNNNKTRIFVSAYACEPGLGSETILARKRELDEEGIRTINSKIYYLAGKNSIPRC